MGGAARYARGSTEVNTMRIGRILPLALLTAAIAAPAAAATIGTATTALNIRSGPGPQFPVIGAIAARSQAVINGCIQGSLWCQIDLGGMQGWVYSQYLITSVAGAPPVVVSRQPAGVPVVTYALPAATVGSAPPPVGAIIAEPADAAPIVLTPPPTVGVYVETHPVQPVMLNGEVVLGAGLPQDVALAPVPDYDYNYAYVNQVPVLVEPTTRRIVYIYR
jgi:uncharacterized protein YraI